MSTTLNGQVLGEAENATRAVLDRLLARFGTTFHEWVALNVTAISGETIERDQLIRRMSHGLKIDESTVSSTIDTMITAGLLEPMDSRVGLTNEGRARHRSIRAAVDGVTARLYADLPADDLATAGRVLTELTARANAELAST